MWKRRTNGDFASEIQSHLDIETDRLIASGMTEDEARHAARRTFGNVTTQLEHFHASRRAAWIESVLRNIRYALRGLVHRPAFAITAILTLAFGIGVNSALFTMFYSLVLRPPPVGEPSRHVNVFRDISGDYMLAVEGRASMLSWPDYVRLRDESTTLEHLAVYRRQTLRLDAADQSSALEGQLVSCNYFSAVRVPLHLGRGFASDECATRGVGNVVVLSHAYWSSRFGSDTSVIGRSLVINAQPMTVIGVAKAGFSGIAIEPSAAWIPITMLPRLQPAAASDFDRDLSWLTAFGRMRDGTALEQVNAELTMVARREDANWPGRTSTVVAQTGSAFLDPESRANVLVATTGAVVFGALILIMCCANVMNLLLARATTRQREIGVRLALGASRSRLLVQLMVESGVLAIAGGALGLVLAWVLPPLIRLSAPDQQLNLVLSPDAWVLVATMVIALASTLVFGLLPALQSTRLQLTSAIRGESSGKIGGAARWRGAAVITQVSVSALLLVVAAMFLRATQRSFNIAPGYDIESVSTIMPDFGPSLGDSLRMRQFYASVRRELEQVAGVQSVAVAMMTPLRGRASTLVDMSGGAGPDSMPALFNEVSGAYFATLQIPLVAGRTFSDDENASEVSAVVNESFAKRAWPGRDAVGQVMRHEGRQLVVVGVARDVQSVSPGIADGPYLYTPASRAIVPGSHQLLVRSGNPPAAMQSLATRIAREFDPNVVVSVRSLDQELERVIAPVRLTGQVASGLGLTALLLAMIGVYGVITFTVSQRSREIGIRMALGATEGTVRGMVFRQGARVVGTGLVIGVVAAIGFSQAIRSVLFGLGAIDGVALGGVVLVLSGVAAIAVAIPAVRAARVDPMTSLRAE